MYVDFQTAFGDVTVTFQPKVWLIARPQVYRDGINAFGHNYDLNRVHIPFTNAQEQLDAEELIEIAGRTCYQSFEKGRSSVEYFENILESKHFSVIEHANWSFMITCVSRSLTHEFVRHRHLSFSQLSQRYVDKVVFVVPPVIQKVNKHFDIWLDSVGHSLRDYNRLLSEIEGEKKVIRQTARSVLPNSTETRLVVTGNARAWRHFLSLRATKLADTEIRLLAIEIWKLLKDEAPKVFGDFKFDEDTLVNPNPEV